MPSSIESMVLNILDVTKRIQEILASDIGDSQKLDQFNELLQKYLEARKAIRLELIKPENAVIAIENDEVRSLLHGILSSQGTTLDNAIRGFCKAQDIDETTIDHLLGNRIDVDVMGQEVSDHLFSWFGPNDYINRIYEIGAIILGAGKLPSFLNSYMIEARDCYGFSQYLAVISLSRAILEISLHDMNQKKWERVRGCALPEQEFRSGDMRDVVDELFDQDYPLRRETHYLITQMNKVAHGNLYLRSASSMNAKEIFQTTLELIHKMYAHLGF